MMERVLASSWGRAVSAKKAREARRKRVSGRGMTLIEIIVAITIMSMVSLLIYGSFESMNRAKKGESMRIERARQGRDAVLRMARELSSAFLSMHHPNNRALIARQTVFMAQNGSPFDRVDFASFAHRRVELDSRESDQAEVGYFVVKDPDVPEKMDLVRREQTPIDMEPTAGGTVNVLAENVESFELKYLDAQTGLWTDSWDTTQVSGQPNRLPLEIKIALTMKAVPGSPARTFTTKLMLPMQQPLSFGISQ